MTPSSASSLVDRPVHTFPLVLFVAIVGATFAWLWTGSALWAGTIGPVGAWIVAEFLASFGPSFWKKQQGEDRREKQSPGGGDGNGKKNGNSFKSWVSGFVAQ